MSFWNAPTHWGLSRTTFSRTAWQWFTIALLLCIAFAPTASDAVRPTLTLYTEEYPPINYSDQGEASGLSPALVREMLRRTGYQASIKVVPWARGYESAQQSANTGIFVASRTAEREPLFKWVGPLSMSQGFLYAKRDGSFSKPAPLDAARSAQSIVVPREWYLHQLLREKGFTNFHPVTGPAQATLMLRAGRASLMAMDQLALFEISRQEGIPATEFVPVSPINVARQYLIFSLSTSDAVVGELQAALDGMRADGTLASIYGKWLPGVTPPK